MGKSSGKHKLLFLFVLGRLGRPGPPESKLSSAKGEEPEKGIDCMGLHKLDIKPAGGSSSPS